jgi:DNA-binding transcriptional LysR family regulator
MLSLMQLKVLAAVARHGSVTAAAKDLHYSQPAVSHHLARLEAETGAKLVQRVGRGIRLTPVGQLLAHRATEIVGRVDTANSELAAHLGLQAGRVRLVGFQSVLSTLVPRAAALLAREHPGIELNLVDAHPEEALRMLRTGQADLALIFRYEQTPGEEHGFRLVHLLDDPIYLITPEPDQTIDDLHQSNWIAGCERCRHELVAMCAHAGFAPRITSVSDDMVVMQALVAAGMGVTTLPSLALEAHRVPGIHATELPGFPRHIHAVTYGEPPDPPATAALVEALRQVAVAGTP